MRRLALRLLLLAATLAGCASSPSSLPTPLPTQPRCSVANEPSSLCVVILGDSIAAGVGVSDGERWWVRLQSHLTGVLPDRVVEVDNWAVSGSRVDVLESAARDQPALDSYDMAIVIEGVNDEASLPVDAWAPRYEAAIAEIERHGVLAIVATPPPSFENGAFMTRYDATAAAVRDVATRGRPLLDIAKRWHDDGAARAAAYFMDLIHPSVEGQRLIAEMARDMILQAVAVPADPPSSG